MIITLNFYLLDGDGNYILDGDNGKVITSIANFDGPGFIYGIREDPRTLGIDEDNREYGIAKENRTLGVTNG